MRPSIHNFYTHGQACLHATWAPRPHRPIHTATTPNAYTGRKDDYSGDTREQKSFANRGRRPPPPGRKPPPPPPKQDYEIPVVRIGSGQTSTFFSSSSWAECGAQEDLIAALTAIGVTRPSQIQAAAMKALSTGAPHVALADHAGSGKTLAYLAPLAQALKQEEIILGGRGTTPNCPRAIIVVPTSELCAQVLRVARALSQNLKFRAVAATGGRPIRYQKEALKEGVDVLIGTPRRLQELLEEGDLRLDLCGAIVCDEVDVLLGGASLFAEQVAPLRRSCPSTTKWILVTATLPADTYADLEPLFPGIVAALGPGLHRNAPGVDEQIVDCSGGNEITEESGIRRKCAALFASLQSKRALRTIVFCNKIETCRKVENFLNRTFTPQDNVTVLPYHAAVSPEGREKNLTALLLPPPTDDNKKSSRFSPSGGLPSSAPPRLILVCTDRASRGVDSAYVDHVILFDFPRDPSEYVRRVGRTGRGAGGEGLVTVLVLGRQVKLAQDVIGRNERGLPVHALPAVIRASDVVNSRSSDAARFLQDVKSIAATNDTSSTNE